MAAAMQQPIGATARRRQELIQLAANGDIDAAASLESGDKQREQRERLRQKAAAGDEKAIQTIQRRKAMNAERNKKRSAAEKAKREAGDTDAIERYRLQKQRLKEATKERLARKWLGADIAQAMAYTSDDEKDVRWGPVHLRQVKEMRLWAKQVLQQDVTQGSQQRQDRADSEGQASFGTSAAVTSPAPSDTVAFGEVFINVFPEDFDAAGGGSLAIEAAEHLGRMRQELGAEKMVLEERLREVEKEMAATDHQAKD